MRLPRTAIMAVLVALGYWSGAQTVQDIRIINGQPVDLGPVHKWFATRQGDRPMPHWKELQILEFKGKVGAWDRCRIKNEAGLSVEVFLANSLASARNAILSGIEKTNAIATLRQRIAADKVLERDLRRYLVDTPNDIVKTTSSTRGSTVDNDQTRRDNWRAAKDRLEQEEEQLRTLESADDSTLAQATKVYAMFTGRKYTDLEIWDCGSKRK